MRLQRTEIEELPKLAWQAAVDFGRGLVEVQHGAWVEGGDRFLVEGVWDGPFSQGRFDRTEAFFGSGVVLRGGGVVFVPSAATTDALFYGFGADGGRLHVSNSLPVLLAGVDRVLDPRYRRYDAFHDSILHGIRGYERRLPTASGEEVRRFVFHNLHVAEGVVTERPKPLPPRFSSYHEYDEYLDDAYGRIASNGRDPARRRPVAIFSTQSRGYDTTAVNSIAARYGVDKVFTCNRSKGAGAYAGKDAATEKNDDGSEICRHLGLDCVTIDRRSYASGFPEEHLYFAALHAPQDANLREIHAHIDRPTALLTGCFGELWYSGRIWGSKAYRPLSEHQQINADLIRLDMGGNGLAEVRLHAGFIHLPLPYLGGQRRADVFRITNSSEMQPWSLATDYDRPIPRRIAEERGVPRELFGQRKMAAVVELPSPRVPVSPELRREYFEFLRANGLASGPESAAFPLVHFLNEKIHFGGDRKYYAERILGLVARRKVRIRELWQSLNGSVYCFAVNRLANRYRDHRSTPAS